MAEESIIQQTEDEIDVEDKAKTDVEEAITHHTDEDECGCDVEINDEDATLDEDLPAAEGGVA